MQGVVRIVPEYEKIIANTMLLIILLVQGCAGKAKVEVEPKAPIPSIEFVAKDGRSFKMRYNEIDVSIARSILAEYEAQSSRYRSLWEWSFLDEASIYLSYQCVEETCSYTMGLFITCNGWYFINFNESIEGDSRKYVYREHGNTGYECCMTRQGYREPIHDVKFRPWFSR
ncbi:hypothetical protein [Saccharophagus degradans]|uniref:Lipoprotein n=1 Tax=Saccharophagus degradans TaxID=86304 RepID=A0AAW7XEP0_9GAMM|nr:hypothetical protein [Saccharophagus degradans]MDO6424902.1 hypothetical protein [Saccharophagus degradans]MDO6607598.1 hypothetical protein [Saccharophagus degradans]